MVGTPEFILGVPPTPDQVRTARLFAAAVARHYACDEDRIGDLKLAISEACTNSIKAHSDAGVPDAVRVVARYVDGWLRFDVVDAGPGFELQADLDSKADVTPAMGFYEGSLGLAVIRSLFPDVEINRNDDSGMTVSFRIEPGTADASP
jgi:serine/threonine-protein kinase RsbW